MKNVKTDLRVVFVDTNRHITREILTTCQLYRYTKTNNPYISIDDGLVLEIINHDDNYLVFYDIGKARFNFNVTNLMNLRDSSQPNPDEIIIEILEVIGESGERTYVHLEPGLWEEDEVGRYRICDNAIMQIIMHDKVLPMVKKKMIGFEDGAAMTLFYSLKDNVSLHFFEFGNNSEESDELDADDDEEYADCACDGCSLYNEDRDECTCDYSLCDDCDNTRDISDYATDINECVRESVNSFIDHVDECNKQPTDSITGCEDKQCTHKCCDNCKCDEQCESRIHKPKNELPKVVIHKKRKYGRI
jgi:hypothetical protein